MRLYAALHIASHVDYRLVYYKSRTRGTREKTQKNSNCNIYWTRSVAGNKIKLSNSERNDVEPSEKSKAVEPSCMLNT